MPQGGCRLACLHRTFIEWGGWLLAGGHAVDARRETGLQACGIVAVDEPLLAALVDAGIGRIEQGTGPLEVALGHGSAELFNRAAQLAHMLAVSQPADYILTVSFFR